MVCWKITMNNGKSYFVETDNNNVNEILTILFKPETVSTWNLISSSDNTVNTIAIRNDDVSTVEYNC